jgi:class 3 adenylate cyclase
MREIAEWLKKLGMSEYAQCFAENRIDFAVLRDLTDQDLKDLGVVLGDRRTIPRAISEFDKASLAAPAAPTTPAPRDAGERRQVTVMFSDLVGSTALSARMDPEDLREVISAYQKCVTETVRGFGGFVAKYMGDGVLVYFGYPQAHDDDAERAVRAGLQLIAAVSALKSGTPLQTRVGMATGLVVVGDLIGSGASPEQAIVGETPNLAARLQGVAQPNSVVIAESTRKLVGNLFELEDLGARDLKGIAGPVRAWAALRPASVESRFEALQRAALPTSWAGKKNSNCCYGAGRKRRPAKAKWCCCPARQVSANRALRPCSCNALLGSPTPACVISAPRSTRTARSTRSSVRWNAPQGSRMATPLKQSSTSWMLCWLEATHRLKIGRSLPSYYRYPMMDAIPKSSWRRSNGDNERSKRSLHKSSH